MMFEAPGEWLSYASQVRFNLGDVVGFACDGSACSRHHASGFHSIPGRCPAKIAWSRETGRAVGYYCYQLPGDFERGAVFHDGYNAEHWLPIALPSLSQIFVLPEHREQGLATRMVKDFFRERADYKLATTAFHVERPVQPKMLSILKKILSVEEKRHLFDINMMAFREEVFHTKDPEDALVQKYHDAGKSMFDFSYSDNERGDAQLLKIVKAKLKMLNLVPTQ